MTSPTTPSLPDALRACIDLIRTVESAHYDDVAYTCAHFIRQHGPALEALLREREWRPIESAPKDVLILIGPTKRMDICAAMNHSRDGWVTETPGEWVSIYTPTHWMPLPAGPNP